jgi:hypothetical protein
LYPPKNPATTQDQEEEEEEEGEDDDDEGIVEEQLNRAEPDAQTSGSPTQNQNKGVSPLLIKHLSLLIRPVVLMARGHPKRTIHKLLRMLRNLSESVDQGDLVGLKIGSLVLARLGRKAVSITRDSYSRPVDLLTCRILTPRTINTMSSSGES